MKYLIIILFLLYTCSYDNNFSFEYYWMNTNIKYTKPEYFIKRFPFKSKISYVTKLTLKNNSNDSLPVCFKLSKDSTSLDFTMLIKDKKVKMFPSFYHNNNYLRVLKIGPKDSLNFEMETEIIDSISYEQLYKNDSIYYEIKKTLNDAKIFLLADTQRKEIQKYSSYFVSSFEE